MTAYLIVSPATRTAEMPDGRIAYDFHTRASGPTTCFDAAWTDAIRRTELGDDVRIVEVEVYWDRNLWCMEAVPTKEP